MISHPAHQRRAPLRLEFRLDPLPGLRPGHPAHQRRAPLRQGDQRPADLRAVRRVIPPTSGGLHCGSSWVSGISASVPRHPAHQRRAPLRHGVREERGKLLPGSSRPPAAGSIAAHPPLALDARKVHPQVIPPTSGGLHCGAVRPSPSRILTICVIPPTSGGLHCGC